MSFERKIYCLFSDPEFSGKMIFLSGPRQTGKTFLAKQWLDEKDCLNLYYNWDDEKVRREFRKDAHFFESSARYLAKRPRLVLDEIHKATQWKNIVKGYYDVFAQDFDFMVTGSARLDLFQRSGDSLLGRYHLLHLNPLTPPEIVKREKRKIKKHANQSNLANSLGVNLFEDDMTLRTFLDDVPYSQDLIEALIEYSGFPDPFQKSSIRSLNLWHREYRIRLLREDLRDLSRISDLDRVEHCFDLLKTKVSSPLSLNALREDLNCSFDAVKTIVSAFERIALIILVKPYHKKIKYSLTREPKLYFYDWSLINDAGARFENFMAIQLKTWCDLVNDAGFAEVELFYLRDKQKREVDFLVTFNGKPQLLVEAKTSADKSAATHLSYFAQILGVKQSYCVTREKNVWMKLDAHSWMVSAQRFFNLLWAL